MRIQNKQQALEVLENLPTKVLIRMAQLSQNEKAKSYFTCPIKYGAVKGFLK